jgi:hypothetical protein
MVALESATQCIARNPRTASKTEGIRKGFPKSIKTNRNPAVV